jgi:hypothetical protein
MLLTIAAQCGVGAELALNFLAHALWPFLNGERAHLSAAFFGALS